MARTFASSIIRTSVGAFPNTLTFTWCAIVKPRVVSGTMTMVDSTLSGNTNQFNYSSTGYLLILNGSFRFASSPIVPTTGWEFIALTKGPGSVTSRYHRYVYATDTWTRSNTSGTAPGVSGTPTAVAIGSTTSSAQPMDGDLAAVGIYDYAMSDSAIDAMPFSLMTWASCGPKVLWVLDQSATTQPVLDWSGGGADQSSITGTSVSANSVPILSYGHPVILPTRTSPPPPWLNQASGVAARNGTTSHAINFGYTSTSGSELVVIVYGGVTHDEHSGAWTQRLAPVSSGEMDVFTKTSAGESSIVIDHNGSNYPVGWAAYELPAGSTWTDGTASNLAGTDAPPTLSGLPGTAQFVISALGRVASSSGVTSASAVWDSPWAEDSDLFTGFASSTDGMFLTVGHQTGVTASSASPSPTPTYGGANTPADRQAVTFAFAIGAGGSSTTASAGTADITVAGQSPTPQTSVTVSAGAAAVSVAGQDPTAVTVTATTANTGLAVVGVDALNPATALAANAPAGQADVTVTAESPSLATTSTASADLASVVGDAFGAGASGSATVTAGSALVAADAFAATATTARTPDAGIAAADVAAFGATVGIAYTADAGAAGVSADASNATVANSYTATAVTADVIASATNPATTTASNALADVALVDASATNPTVSTSSSVTVTADVAAVGVDAFTASQQIIGTAGQAQVAADAQNPTAVTVAAGIANAGVADVAADALAPAAQPALVVGAGQASVATDALNPSAVSVPFVVAAAGVADVTASAPNPTAQPILIAAADVAPVATDAFGATVSTEASFTAQAGVADVGVTAGNGQPLAVLITAADVAAVATDAFGVAAWTEAATVAAALTALATSDAFGALLQVVVNAGVAEVGATAFAVPKQRRAGILTAGTIRSHLVAGTTRGPSYGGG